ncbi:MAG: transcriptional regulator [Alphaproteobacteria bacterium]|nr:MAG: transcriptional regulator [Alphaproteobacteria bacterium]
MVVDGYKGRFEQAGETVARIGSQEFEEWIGVSGDEDLASVEAFIIGECDNPEGQVARIRKVSEAPVVVLIDARNLEQVVRLFNCGVDDVVAKPVHYQELAARIAAIKKRLIRAEATGGRHRHLAIFFDGRDPEVDGEPLSLPRRERRILEYLASIRGRRATKSQIFNAIYGVFDEHVEECVIESHISKLRKKLKMRMGHDPIDSKRYLGYRLELGREVTAGDEVVEAEAGSIAA